MTEQTRDLRLLFLRRAHSAAAGSSGSYFSYLRFLFSHHSLGRSMLSAYRAFRRSMLVSRIVRYGAIVLTIVRTGLSAVLAGALFGVLLALSVLPALLLMLVARIDARRARARLAAAATGKRVLVFLPPSGGGGRPFDCEDAFVLTVSDAYFGFIGRGYLNMKVNEAGHYQVSRRFYCYARTRLQARAERLVEIY